MYIFTAIQILFHCFRSFGILIQPIYCYSRKNHKEFFRKMEKAKVQWMEFIDISLISEDFKVLYKQLIQERFTRLLPK